MVLTRRLGQRQRRVRLVGWADGAVAVMGRQTQASSGANPGAASTGPILALDASEYFAIACGFHGAVSAWDMRMLRPLLLQPGAGNTQPFLSLPNVGSKAVLAPDGQVAAVSYGSTIRLLNLGTGQVTDFSLRADALYTDLRWSALRRQLFVGTQAGAIDVFDAEYS